MSGKSLICSAFSPALALLLIFSAASAFAQNNEPAGIRKVYVNGYYFDKGISPAQILGLRLKARADLFYRDKNYASAVKYYEQASTYLPDEAEIYFNLGNIYYDRRIDNLAADYYKRARDKYPLVENFLKSKRDYYLSLVRYGITLARLSKSNNSDEDSKMAKEIYWQVSGLQPAMTNDFPETARDVATLNKTLFGDVTVIKK
ncbi:MAG: tetratricopeptide repeat protein [Brevinematales bacterium]|jgi:tetratricopeptide (TPR) repeat protein